MITTMEVKAVDSVPDNTTIYLAELESIGQIWGLKSYIDIIGATMLQMIKQKSNFISPTIYHSIPEILNLLGYQIGTIVIDEEVPNIVNSYRATLGIYYGDVLVHNVKVRGSDAIVLSALLYLPLQVDTRLCYKIPQDPKKIQDFTNKVKPEDFDENNDS